MATATTSIVLVNYNGGEALHRSIESLVATAPAAEVVVIDNASTDGSADLPAHLAKHVRLIRHDTNRGYSAALNRGAKETTGEILVFSNMDTLFEQGWLEPLVEQLARDPQCGAVNPLIVLMDGERVNAAGQNVHVTALGFNRGLHDPVSKYGRQPFEVSGIQGAVFAMRRRVYERIGPFDEVGFLYHEDVDISWLLLLAGYTLYCVPASRVRHDYFLSMYAEKFHQLERNRVAMLLAYVGWPARLLLSPLLLLTELFAWLYALLRRHGFASAKWRSYRWVAAHEDDIAQRRRLAARLRVVSDWHLLQRLRWAYDWRQFAVLAREGGRGARRREVISA